jgi:tetratricopeptide (TPR) repeat protein
LLDKGWISLADFYIQKRKYKKALYYLKKALQIDTSNIVIWKQYVLVNEKLLCYEEASLGYKEIVSLGNYELEIWINWARVLHKLGDFDQAVTTLLQGAEFYPEAAEINYLLAGMYFLLMQEHKGLFYLKNAYRSNPRKYRIFLKEFPTLSNSKLIKESLPSSEKN